MKDDKITIDIIELNLDEKHELSRFFEDLGVGYSKKIAPENGASLTDEASTNNNNNSSNTRNVGNQQGLDLNQKYIIHRLKTRTKRR